MLRLVLLVLYLIVSSSTSPQAKQGVGAGSMVIKPLAPPTTNAGAGNDPNGASADAGAGNDPEG